MTGENDVLRNLRVSSKLLVLIAAPLLALVTLASLAAYEKVAAARRSTSVEHLTQIVIDVMPVVDQIQKERLTSSVVLLTGDAEKVRQLQSQRRITDTVASQLRDTIDDVTTPSLPPAVDETIEAVLADLSGIARGRSMVDEALAGATGSAPPVSRDEVVEPYSAAVEALHDAAAAVAEEFVEVNGDISGDSRALSDMVAAYLALAQAKELASLESGVVYAAASADGFRGDEYNRFVQLATGHDLLIESFRSRAPGHLVERYDETVRGTAVRASENMRERAMASAATAGLGISPERWLTSMQDKGEMLRDVLTSVTALNSQADRLQAEALETASIYVGGALVLVALAALAATIVGRSITRPLRQLTDTADDIRQKLPVFVEEMRRPDDQPDVVIEPIHVGSRDEVGQLAEAFNAVNAVTLQVTREQAALRAGIAEMFVNLARRNQSLLDRQLSFIDSLEATERDPDSLERLFKLDHLATRMRRNAESLLVLAGNEPVQRWSEPLPLADVMRAAMSEVEAYDRIELSKLAHVDVLGNAVSSVAHLFAELLENALTFSPPETPVRVEAHRVGPGVTVTVTDGGLGMSDEQLHEANAHLAEPPLVDIAVSKRLGFFVVGQLAARFGIAVELRHATDGGVAAVVELPGAIIVSGQAPPALLPVGGRDPDTDRLPALRGEIDRGTGPDLPASSPEPASGRELPSRRTPGFPEAEPPPEPVVASHEFDNVASLLSRLQAGDGSDASSRPAAEALPVRPVPAAEALPVRPAPAAEALPLRPAMAAQASMSPVFQPAEAAPAHGLARRVPQQPKEAEAAPVAQDRSAPLRDPAQIRSMFSEFQMAMEDGRSGQARTTAFQPRSVEPAHAAVTPSPGAAEPAPAVSTATPASAEVSEAGGTARSETVESASAAVAAESVPVGSASASGVAPQPSTNRGRHRAPRRGLFSTRPARSWRSSGGRAHEPLQWSVPATVSPGVTDDDAES